VKKFESSDLPRILIVEDDPIIARDLRQRLKTLGYDAIAIAPTGEEAIERAQVNSPDLVLMDIALEGAMDGTQAAEIIHSSSKIPIVFVTAYTDDKLLEHAKKAEPFGYIVKPYTEKDLHVTIEMALYKSQAEKALVQAKEEWERTFDAVPDCMMILDRKHRILRANKATAEKLGLTMRDLVGAHCYKLFHGTDSPPSFCPYVKLLSSGESGSVETCDRHLNGTFEVSVSPVFSEGGDIVASVHVARDISQRVEDQKKKADLMEEIKQFAYIVSHDLRSPLNSLKGFSQELKTGIEIIRPVIEKALPSLEHEEQSRVKCALEEDIVEALEFVDSSVEQMGRLIEAVLDLSRSGRRRLSFERLDTYKLVHETLKTLDYRLSDRQVKVAVGSLPDTVADRTAMEQIFLNLVDNAVKYLVPDRPGEVEISGHRFPANNVYVVRDNGRGIDESHLPRIFYVFQRVGKQDVPGEGMGLAHVRTLVRRHGGSIWCESEPGIGSSFTFTISNRLTQDGETS